TAEVPRGRAAGRRHARTLGRRQRRGLHRSGVLRHRLRPVPARAARSPPRQRPHREVPRGAAERRAGNRGGNPRRRAPGGAPMSFSGDLLNGLAAFLAAAGAGTYRSDGTAYTSGETAIVFAAMPQTPDRAIVLSAYPVTDDPSLSDSVIGM